MMKVIQNKIQELLLTPHFSNGKKIKVRLFAVDRDLNMIDVELKSKKLKTNQGEYFIVTLYYYCESHLTQGGNIYLKPNFEIVILNHNKKVVELKHNNWKVINLIAFGTCEFGYPQKVDLKFQLQDQLNHTTDWISNPYFSGGYEDTITQKIKYIFKTVKAYSKYQCIESYTLGKKVDVLERKMKILK